jgi:16S rRNA (guanine527-N7)-methyltransferase
MELPSRATPLLATHLDMTLRWSDAISLTSIRTPEAAVRRHVIESMVAASFLNARAGALLDIGSGNGYPALPLLCLHPGLAATLLEPAIRKSVFLEAVVRACGLESVRVLRERVDRAADISRYSGTGNISMRAVNALGPALEGAAAVLPEGGRVLLFLGEDQAQTCEADLPPGLGVLESRELPLKKKARLLVLQRS